MKQLLVIISVIFIAKVSNAQINLDYFGQTPPQDIPQKFTVYPHGNLSLYCPPEKEAATGTDHWPFSFFR